MRETETLAGYIAEADYDDLPAEVVTRAKQSFADTLACGLGGRKTRDADALLDAMTYLGGEGEATVIGDRTRLPFLSAAQVNRVICNALDYDDTHMKAGHLSSALVPVALNVGEKLNASGRDVLNALVLGYEVVSRVRTAVDPSEEVFWTTFERVDSGLNLGVTAVAGKLFGLDAGQMADALGLAGHVRSWRITFPNRAQRGMPPWMKITGGDTLVPGVHSVLLAKRGVPGDRGLLDDGRGYHVSVGSDRYDATALVADLGRRYETLRLGYKLYSSCRHTSTSADAVSELVAEHGIGPRDVEQVVVRVQKHVSTHFGIYEPSNMIQAQFSLPYVVSMVLLGIP
ncbi:MAG: MmgE/PrpD family protein, partial [Deltaproteobacteria bacterium]|nr:MmgE/PrpD family protein [Deltaproteobacteria bacterium]